MSKSKQITDLQLAEIMKLPKQDQGLAFLLISSAKTPIQNLRGYIQKVRNRDIRPTAFISLDERADEGDFSISEKIASLDPQEALDAIALSRRASLDETTETVLSVVTGTANSVATRAGCCKRTAQYKRKKLIEEYSGVAPQLPLFVATVAEVLE